MVRASRNVARDAHPNTAVSAQVRQIELRNYLDQRVTTRTQLAFTDHVVANDAVSLIAQDRFEKTDFQRVPQIEHTKSVLEHASTGIAEPAWCVRAAKRLGISGQVDTAKRLPGTDCRNMEPRAREVGRRIETRHLRERLRYAFRRLNYFFDVPFLERLSARHAAELGMMLHQEPVHVPCVAA